MMGRADIADMVTEYGSQKIEIIPGVVKARSESTCLVYLRLLGCRRVIVRHGRVGQVTGMSKYRAILGWVFGATLDKVIA